MSVASASPTKTQFYSANGYGRDSYIYGNNGGFCPATEPCKIDGISKLSPFRIAHTSFLAELKPGIRNKKRFLTF
jgi:hypothetical protein